MNTLVKLISIGLVLFLVGCGRATESESIGRVALTPVPTPAPEIQVSTEVAAISAATLSALQGFAFSFAQSRVSASQVSDLELSLAEWTSVYGLLYQSQLLPQAMATANPLSKVSAWANWLPAAPAHFDLSSITLTVDASADPSNTLQLTYVLDRQSDETYLVTQALLLQGGVPKLLLPNLP